MRIGIFQPALQCRGKTMDIAQRIYVEFSPGLKARLNNRISLREALSFAEIGVVVDWHAVPPSDPAEPAQGLVESVSATAIAVSLVAAVPVIESAVSQYLEHKAVSDTHFVYWVNEPLLESNGAPVLDAAGEPRTIRRPVSGVDAFPNLPDQGITLTIGEQSASVEVDRGDLASAAVRAGTSEG
jgi:hypothetical protein